MAMNYFDRPEVSNSDLTALKKYFIPEKQYGDIQAAYRFGTLIDALITEPQRVDVFQLTCDDVHYSAEEFDQAKRMKKAFMKDPFCRIMLERCETQKISIVQDFRIEHAGHKFRLPARGKWDLFGGAQFHIDGDIKSTAAKNQKEFEEAIRYFDYQRQAAWYMNLENRNQFMIIGISKVNDQIFKVAIRRDDELFKDGLASYQELAFRYWYLFGNINNYESQNFSHYNESL